MAGGKHEGGKRYMPCGRAVIESPRLSTLVPETSIGLHGQPSLVEDYRATSPVGEMLARAVEYLEGVSVRAAVRASGE